MTYQIRGNTYPHRAALKELGCRWDPQAKAWTTADQAVAARARELVGDGQALNRAPPVDLVGDQSPAVLAARYGREPAPGAELKDFDCYGLARGNDGLPNGSIRTVGRVRYLQVARTRREYLSADQLEDMDCFDTRPGGHYQWTGVAVLPTATEAAEDALNAAAKKEAEEREAARKALRAEVDVRVRCAANLVESIPAGLQDCWGHRGLSGHHVVMSDGARVAVSESSYDDEPRAWVLEDAELAGRVLAAKGQIRT